VHRNRANEDGAVVIAPGTPRARFLLFAFDGQAF
jgi:hypothetical protein